MTQHLNHCADVYQRLSSWIVLDVCVVCSGFRVVCVCNRSSQVSQRVCGGVGREIFGRPSGRYITSGLILPPPVKDINRDIKICRRSGQGQTYRARFCGGFKV